MICTSQAPKPFRRSNKETNSIMNAGKRIVIVGISASGKSTFAKQLAQKISIPVTFMDTIMWKPGWVYVGDAEVVKKLEVLCGDPAWIIEGYIPKAARTFVFEKADTIVYLDYAPMVASWRYIKRWWQHRRHSRPELEGSPEKFSFKFLRLVWNKGEAVSLNKFLSEVKDQKKIVTLCSLRETQRFLEDK